MGIRTKLFLSLFVTVAILHSGALAGGFVWDDHRMIPENPSIRDLGNVPGMFHRNYFGDRANSELFRPLVNVSLALDYAVWGGDGEGRPTPFPFHLTNLLLHLVAGGLLYALLRRLVETPGVAEIGAMVFLVHPASAESVAWIVARGDLLATVLGLATIHLHLAGRRRPWLHAAAVLVWLLALFGKLAAAPIPLLILLVETFFCGLAPRQWLEPRNLLRYASYGIAAGIYFAVRANAMGDVFPSGPGRTWEDPELLASAVVAGSISFRMLGTMLIPVGLCADYSADPVFDGGSLVRIAASPLVGLTAFAVPAVIVLALLVRRRAPLVSFGLLWFFVALLPVSQAIRIGAVMADRFLYLPSIGIAVLLAAALVRLPRGRVPLGLLLFACLAALTWGREAVWRNDVTMNEDVLAAYPDDPDAWNRLGIAYGRRDEPVAEIAAYREGLARSPRHRYLLKNLGAAFLEAGRLPEAREALGEALRSSRRMDLQAARIAYNLARVMLRQGEAADAAQLLDRVLSGTPRLSGELRERLVRLRDHARRAAAPR